MSNIAQYQPEFLTADTPTSVRFKTYTEGGLHISVRALTDAGVLDNTIWQGTRDYNVQTLKSKTWAYKKENGRNYYQYDCLPKSQKEKVDKFYGDIYAALMVGDLKQGAANCIEQNDLAYFLGLKVRKDGTGYSASEARDLVAACGWLRMLESAIENKVWKQGLQVSRDCKIDNKTPFMAWVATVIKPLNLYGFKVGNGLTLTAKVAEFQAKGRECLVSQYFNNDNAGLLEPRHIDFMIVHYAQHKKSMPQIVQLLKQCFGLVITRQAVEFHLSKPENKQKYIVAREGYLVAAKATKSYFKIADVPYCDALWLVDASPFALFADDGNGVRKSTKTAVYVRDAKSRKCVGVAFGETETGELVKIALRNAITQTGFLPHALRYDGGSANVNQEMKRVFDILSDYHFPNAPYAPTGKFAVEQLVNEIENVLKGFDNFAGGNITRRGTEKSFNPDVVKAMKKEGRMPTSDQTGLQMWAAIEVVNNTRHEKDGKTPNERYANDAHPSRRKATTPLVAAAFWELRPRAIRYENGGIEMQTGKNRLQYHVGTAMVEDYQFKVRNEGKRFFIRENPNDRSVIALYDDNDRFVEAAVLKHGFSLLPDVRTDGEGEAWRIGMAQNKQYLADGQTAFQEAKERLEAENLPTEFDFMTLNKEALSNMEGAAAERLLDVMSHTTKKKTPKTGKVTPVKPTIGEAQTDDDFDFLTIMGQ